MKKPSKMSRGDILILSFATLLGMFAWLALPSNWHIGHLPAGFIACLILFCGAMLLIGPKMGSSANRKNSLAIPTRFLALLIPSLAGIALWTYVYFSNPNLCQQQWLLWAGEIGWILFVGFTYALVNGQSGFNAMLDELGIEHHH